MERGVLDDEVQIIGPPNPALFVQDAKPLEIYLEGFPVTEFLDLMKIIKGYGGKMSNGIGDGVIVLSHPECSFETESSKFHINWLHDCINSNRILNLSKYLLEFPTPNVKSEVAEEDYYPIESMNVRSLQEPNAADFHCLREAIIKLSKVLSLPQTLASPDIINENPVPESSTSEIERSPECKRCSQQPVFTSYDFLEENESSKSKRHFSTTSSLLNSSIGSSPRLELSTSNIEDEADYNNVSGAMIGISEVFPFPQAHVSTDMNENTVPKNTLEIRETPKRRRCSHQPVYTSCDLPEVDKSSKNKYILYTDEEDRAMVQYLIDNDAIHIAAGRKIWRKMHKDKMMLHRSPESMKCHYRYSLHGRIRDFTSDEVVLRKFQLRDTEAKCKGRKRRRLD